MARSARSDRAMVKQLVIILVLLLLFALLAVTYYLLTRPPEVEGSAEDRDRRFLFSIYGFEGDLLRRPTGVGIDSRGNIHVADTGKRRIAVFDSNGRFVRVYGEAGKGDLLIYDPIDVAITPDGRAWVVDKTQGKIVEFDVTGRAVRDIVTPELPLSITYADENLFVTVESGVLVADLDGNLLTGYVRRGKEAGSFDRPGGVAVGEDGTLYVADTLNYRVQALSTQGQPIWQYGEPLPSDAAIQFSAEQRKFGLPSNIAIDETGLLYVVDGLNSELKVLDTDGQLIEVIGDVGHEDGRFYYPDGIDYGNGRIAIADKFNDRVSVFRTPLPPGQQWRAFVPYIIGLLLLPLLILPFLRRGRRYVLTPDVLDALVADGDRDIVTDALKRVFVTEELAVLGRSHEDVDLKWQDREPKDEDVERIAERFDLAPVHVQALAIALGLRGKRLLVTGDEGVRIAARELEVPVVSYEEIKRAIEEQGRKGGPSKTPPAGGEGGEA